MELQLLTTAPVEEKVVPAGIRTMPLRSLVVAEVVVETGTGCAEVFPILTVGVPVMPTFPLIGTLAFVTFTFAVPVMPTLPETGTGLDEVFVTVTGIAGVAAEAIPLDNITRTTTINKTIVFFILSSYVKNAFITVYSVLPVDNKTTT